MRRKQFAMKHGLAPEAEDDMDCGGGDGEAGDDGDQEPVAKKRVVEEKPMSSAASSSMTPAPGSAGLKRDASRDGGWEELAAKIRRRTENASGDDSEMIMEVMCEETVPDELDWEIEQYKDANLEEEVRTSWAHSSCVEDQEVSGHVLEHDEVVKARWNEIEGLASMGVWEIVPREQCIEKTGKPPIRGRWVDINKGDDQDKVYRSRYVAM